MTPEIKNTLIQVLNTAIGINQRLLSLNYASEQKNRELTIKQQKLDNAINWVKEQ
jgi:hypothetical protein